MSDCKFKIGETYKDREGGEWVLVARNDEYKRPLVFRHKNTGGVILRGIDGRTVYDREGRGDVLPNIKREWVVTYRNHVRRSYTVCDSECEAIDQIKWFHEVNERRVTAGLDPLYTDIRGPVLWEYQE